MHWDYNLQAYQKHLVFRPDHGQRILHDFDHPYHPGYPLLGRLKGLSEINGFIQALELDH